MEGLTHPSLAMSTFRPSRPSSSSMSAAWSRRLAPSLHVTSRSTSLSGRASPRATDPINRTSVAPCLPAMRMIASRFSRIVSPTVGSATPCLILEVYRRCSKNALHYNRKLPSPSPLRWRMISLAFWATVINYLDRQTLSVAAPVLREQFHMSNVDYSRVVFAFLLAYTIMNGVSGPLIDKLGTRVGYALCIAWWSVAAVMHAFARGAVSLGVFRFLLGMGEAGNWPGGVKVVAEWFPERERALAAGLFNSGSAVGAILAPPIVAFL